VIWQEIFAHADIIKHCQYQQIIFSWLMLQVDHIGHIALALLREKSIKPLLWQRSEVVISAFAGHLLKLL
jgi:hypothetical protein